MLKEKLVKFQAARLESFGSPLCVKPITLPPLGPHEVAVQVHFSGINFYELLIIAGQYSSLPHLPATLGGELAGTVVEIGSRVISFCKGDRVFSFAETGKGTTGSHAERAHINEKYLYHLPKKVSFETGASIPMVAFAAYTMLRKKVRMPLSGTILVYSAAGGVGSTLVQLARVLYPKITIIGTCSNQKKVKIIRSLGADVVINTKKESCADKLHKKFSSSIDVIFDPMGQQYLDLNLSLLRPLQGIICSYGTSTGAIADANLVSKLRKNNLALSGFLMWPLLENKKLCLNIFAEIFRLLKSKRFKPLIDKIFPLKDINKAVLRIRQRKNIGKVLVNPRQSL